VAIWAGRAAQVTRMPDRQAYRQTDPDSSSSTGSVLMTSTALKTQEAHGRRRNARKGSSVFDPVLSRRIYSRHGSARPVGSSLMSPAIVDSGTLRVPGPAVANMQPRPG
jgi:hypothetical protein